MLTKILNFSKKIFFASFLFLNINSSQADIKGLPSEYYKIDDLEKQKKFFFDYLYKLISEENTKILKEREFVKSMLFSNILEINFDSEQFKKLLDIKEKYKIEKLFSLSFYLKKIDIIPPSQALAQAAVESGWGKSRFVKIANNIFGHWTYNPNIGILPEDREIGATHFIRRFKSLSASIHAYMLNLNRNYAYDDFREKRYELRQKKRNLDGLTLSQTMLNYSGIAHEYLNILENVILSNELSTYDKKFYKKLNLKQGLNK